MYAVATADPSRDTSAPEARGLAAESGLSGAVEALMGGYWPKELGHDGSSLALGRGPIALLHQPWRQPTEGKRDVQEAGRPRAEEDDRGYNDHRIDAHRDVGLGA